MLRHRLATVWIDYTMSPVLRSLAIFILMELQSVLYSLASYPKEDFVNEKEDAWRKREVGKKEVDRDWEDENLKCKYST